MRPKLSLSCPAVLCMVAVMANDSFKNWINFNWYGKEISLEVNDVFTDPFLKMIQFTGVATGKAVTWKEDLPSKHQRNAQNTDVLVT